MIGDRWGVNQSETTSPATSAEAHERNYCEV